MKVDSMIKEFTEKYDRLAIESINDISNDFGLKVSNSKIKVFNIDEAFDGFLNYVDGYSRYKIMHANDSNASSQSAIVESANKFVDNMFKECEINYDKLPNFISSYIEGVKSVIDKVDQCKLNMLENGNVDRTDIGYLNDISDRFAEKVETLFDESMDRILWASGYKSKIKLSSNNKKEDDFFL